MADERPPYRRTWFDWLMLCLGIVLVAMWVANRVLPGCVFWLR